MILERYSPHLIIRHLEFLFANLDSEIEGNDHKINTQELHTGMHTLSVLYSRLQVGVLGENRTCYAKRSLICFII